MKKEKKRNKKQKIFYNPMHMTEALREVGAQYDKKELFLFYSVMLGVALALGLLFELRIGYLIFILTAYFLLVPKILYNVKRQQFERQRFNDVNAYMRQMSQSFIYTQNVIDSLRQTEETFPAGRMRETLAEAVHMIDIGGYDIVEAKKNAIQLIENAYNCERLVNLHEFLFLAEARGGKCASEFSVLEKMRNAWKSAVNEYHGKLIKNKMISTFAYLLLLIFCVIFLNVMRFYGIDILSSGITHITNTILIVVFLIMYVGLDNKLNESLLKNAKTMSRKKADEYFMFVNSFDRKKERKKYLALSIFAAITAIIIALYFKSRIGIVVAGIILLAGFNVHNILLVIIKSELKAELVRAFPKWLFDVILLIQRESIEGAIKLSVEKAPPVMQSELQRISNRLVYEPHDKDAYMSFFADFHLLEMEEAMRTLYSIAIGNGGTGEIMNVVIENNIEALNKSERDSISMKASLSGNNVTPILAISFGMIMYLVVAVTLVVSDVISLF